MDRWSWRQRFNQAIEITGAYAAFVAVVATQPGGYAARLTLPTFIEAVVAAFAVLYLLRAILQRSLSLVPNDDGRFRYAPKAWLIAGFCGFATMLLTRFAMGLPSESSVAYLSGFWAFGLCLSLIGPEPVEPD